jgi:hypothetical protein
MVSTVSARPNHYQTLGLKPTASAGEVAQAFAQAIGMFRPRAMGGVAEVSIAYETLRDPTKRRAYDASLGLTREPETVQWPVPAAARFIGSAPADPVARPQAPPEPRLGSFIAESLREPVAPSAPEPQRPPEAQPRTEQPVPAFAAAEEAAGVESRAIAWKRPAVAASALILGVALLGAWAGMSAGGAEEPQPAGPGVTIAVPQAKPLAQVAAPAPAPVRRGIAAQPALPIAAKVAAARTERTPPPPPADTQAAENVATASPQNTTEVAAAEAPPAEAVAANLPLPNKVIARTIERIGYACGEVSSIAAGEASGVYKVTCTSGQSYQASPVNGRYRFRRLGSH